MFKNYFMKFLICLIPVALLSGCATMFTGSTQNLDVKAVDNTTHTTIADAVCTVTDGKGRTYPLSSNPGNVVVKKSSGALQVACHRKGYAQKEIGVGQSFNLWTIANVLFWPGIIVDAVTGAVQKYPTQVTVLMDKKSKRHHA